MAIKYYDKYPQRWESPSQDYPQGAFKNLSALGEQDGSYLEKDWLNDQAGFFGALLRNAEMTPNGLVDTAQKSQFYDALLVCARKAVDLSGYYTKDQVDTAIQDNKTEVVNEWGDSLDKTLSQDFLTKRAKKQPVLSDFSSASSLSAGQIDEIDAGNAILDLERKTVTFAKIPTSLNYTNGTVVVNGVQYQANNSGTVVAQNHNIFAGINAGKSSSMWLPRTGNTGEGKAYGLIGIGESSLESAVNAKNSIAIGKGSLKSLNYGRYNIALGLDALYSLNGTTPTGITASRNIAIGSNTCRFVSEGYANVAVGRNCMQNFTSGSHNVSLGVGSLTSIAPLGLDNNTIVNAFPNNSSNQTGVGANALNRSITSRNTAVGNNAGANITLSSIVALGDRAGGNIDIETGYDGFLRTDVNPSTTVTLYKLNATQCYISTNSLPEDIAVGFRLYLSRAGYDSQYLKVLSKDSDRVVLETLIEMTANSVEYMLFAYTSTKLGKATDGVYIGRNSGLNTSGDLNTFVGTRAGENTTGDSNTTLGERTLSNSAGNRNTAVGALSLYRNNSSFNTAVGYQSGNIDDASDLNTFIGNQAGLGSPTGILNCTMLGAQTKVTGNNQVQLGNEDTTTYVFGTVQNRSDARDKRDITELSIGLDTVMKLKPKQFKWDYREWQGEKTGKRDHVGFIAQDLQEVFKDSNYAFVQDHSVDGGDDVLSVGYDEFIALLVKAIQELSKKVERLEDNKN